MQALDKQNLELGVERLEARERDFAVGLKGRQGLPRENKEQVIPGEVKKQVWTPCIATSGGGAGFG